MRRQYPKQPRDPVMMLNALIRHSYESNPHATLRERVDMCSDAFKIMAESMIPRRTSSLDTRVIYCEKHGLRFERRGRCLTCINEEYRENALKKHSS